MQRFDRLTALSEVEGIIGLCDFRFTIYNLRFEVAIENRQSSIANILEVSSLLPQKSRKLSVETPRTYLTWLLRLVLIVLLPASPPKMSVAGESPDKITKSAAAESGLVEKACELIYQGKFDSAGELIKKTRSATTSLADSLARLAEIVEQAGSINQRRQSAREKAYSEQVADLEKSRAKKDANDVKDANDRSDANDVNDITSALTIITKASEFADQAQKQQLLSDSFVKKTLQKAIDKASRFEVKGKWLEAYTNCYYWLAVIDPNNKAYLDYAEQLLDKAGIAASFQDSPCETRDQRYAGVEKDMFVRAVNALSLNYVSIIDYGQMTTKAIERCKLLADVMGTSFAQNSPNAELVSRQNPDDSNAPKPTPDRNIRGQSEPNKPSVLLADSKKLAAWSAALAGLLDEVKQSPTGFDKDKFLEVFEKVLKLNAAAADLPEAIVIAQFAEAALSALDPYTVVVWPRQVQDFEKMMTNEFTGIGIEISREKGLLTVASLLPDTPAYRSGLDAGDVIQAVDGVETKDMTLVCAVRKITGPKGTKVTLTIKRSGKENTGELTIVRDKITVPTIRGWQRNGEGKWLYLVDEPNKIGYVRITSFSGETSSDLEKALKELEAGGLRGLVLDLRFNSGGLLDSAVEITDKFIKKGLIVKTQPGSGFGRLPTYAVAHEKDTHADYPLVILINAGSASASEIVAGALADQMHKRAILVGDRTHGKGSVQGVTHYPGGGAQLKYTMAYYYLPSGQRVESQDAIKKQGRKDWGVGPNIEIELTSDEMKKMLDVQRDNDVLVQADHTSSGREVKKYTLEETLAADPQLAIGVLVVKAKLIEAETPAQGRQG
jgi:carboxyl-terminal processing protease